MRELTVAKRYAKAIFQVALEKKQLDEIEKDLQAVVELYQESTDLVSWLQSPKTSDTEKKKVFASICKELNSITRNFLFYLVDQNRENLIPQIFAVYKRFYLEEKGMVEATVTTAFPLSKKDQKELIKRFQNLIGKKLIIHEVVDSDLLGGVIVQVGDRLYDGSLRTKLNQFQERLKETRVG